MLAPPPRYSNQAGVVASTLCLACSAGYYSGTPGSVSCTLCPVGYYSPYELKDRPRCLPCASGTFSASIGAVSCVDCKGSRLGEGSTSAQGSSDCTLCKASYYPIVKPQSAASFTSLDNAVSAVERCEACSSTTKCQPNAGLLLFGPGPQYWVDLAPFTRSGGPRTDASIASAVEERGRAHRCYRATCVGRQPSNATESSSCWDLSQAIGIVGSCSPEVADQLVCMRGSTGAGVDSAQVASCRFFTFLICLI